MRRPEVKLKRAYEPPARADGRRVLVDRIWPRGVSKDQLRLDDWLKDLAPSAGLRKWFGHDPAKWGAFKDRYFRELDERPEAVERLAAKTPRGNPDPGLRGQGHPSQQRRRAQGIPRALR